VSEERGRREDFVASDTARTPNTSVTVLNASSTAVVPANPRRISVTITNDGANVVYLSLGGTAALNSGIRVNAGGSFKTSAFTGAINGRAAVADTVVVYSEV
jgi:hypothetical protein